MDSPLHTSPIALEPLLTMTGLTVRVGRKYVCCDLNWQVFPGESWAILGRNGVGKSTLLRVLAGLESPQTGVLRLANKDILQWSSAELARKRAWLPQNEVYAFRMSVLEYVLLGRYPYQQSGHWRHWLAEKDRALAEHYLQLLDLDGLQDHNVQILSGGEQRRVAVAGVLVQEAPLLLLDEPLSQLDWQHQSKVLTAIQPPRAQEIINKAQWPRGIVWATHDLNRLWRYSTHLLLMLGDGRVRMGCTQELLTSEVLTDLYRTPIVQIATEDGVVFLPGNH